MKKSVTVILAIALAVCVGVFLYAGYQLFSIYTMYQEGTKYNTEMADAYVTAVEVTPPPTAAPAETESDVVEIPKEYSPVTVDFEGLLASNEDVCGWLHSPDTVINYVIAQGEDNNQYLHHLLDGSYQEKGTLFMDCECVPHFAGANSIIYGHNMRDGSMFNSLLKYREQEYYDAHPVLYLNTPTQDYKIVAFAAFTCNYDSDTYMLSFASEQDYMDWLNKMKGQSDFDCDVELDSNERTITLSTCTYEYDNARYVLMGKLVPIDKPETAAESAMAETAEAAA